MLEMLIAATLALTPPDGGYASCAKAAADGASDIRAGSPGYNPDLDRDGDGVACESPS